MGQTELADKLLGSQRVIMIRHKTETKPHDSGEQTNRCRKETHSMEIGNQANVVDVILTTPTARNRNLVANMSDEKGRHT